MTLHPRYFVRRCDDAPAVTKVTWEVVDRLTGQCVADRGTRILARAEARERNATCRNHGRLEP